LWPLPSRLAGGKYYRHSLNWRGGALLGSAPSCRIRPADYLDAALGVSAALAAAWYYLVLSLSLGALVGSAISGGVQLSSSGCSSR
jgi:hypothetical protein